MQILILGMHRSGTSALTRLINMMGAYFAPEDAALPVNEANPKGFWERKDVMQVNNELLAFQGCSWSDVAGWDDGKASYAPAATMQKLARIVRELDAHKPWAAKDPRLCITLPCWRPLLVSPVAVVASRSPLEIARSLEMRDKMPPAKALVLWERYAQAVVRHAASLPAIFVHHEELMHSPLEAVERLHRELSAHVEGLRLPAEQEVLSFIDPALHRAKVFAGALSPFQQTLYEKMQGVRPLA
jgi:hypothetical protein